MKRLGYLDTARGFAAIAVLIFHVTLELPSNESQFVNILQSFFINIFDLGKIGVVLFFIISGLVIPYSFKTNSLKLGLSSFAVSRFFRLYPVYWVSAIIGFVLYGTFSYEELLANLTMIQQILGYKNIIGLYWTLQIELIFYFLVSCVFLFKKLRDLNFLFKVSLIFLFISLILAVIRCYFELKLPLALPLALSLMFFATMYRCLLIENDDSVKQLFKKYLVLYSITIPVICWLGYSTSFGNENPVKYVVTYFVGMLLFLLVGKIKFSNSITEYLGKISYSVYLFHPLIIKLYQDIFTTSLNYFVSLSIILFSTVFISHITYYLFEKPFVKLGHKIKSRIIFT